jgi:hypothetical protein
VTDDPWRRADACAALLKGKSRAEIKALGDLIRQRYNIGTERAIQLAACADYWPPALRSADVAISVYENVRCVCVEYDADPEQVLHAWVESGEVSSKNVRDWFTGTYLKAKLRSAPDGNVRAIRPQLDAVEADDADEFQSFSTVALRCRQCRGDIGRISVHVTPPAEFVWCPQCYDIESGGVGSFSRFAKESPNV